jgi:hypothetical protein
MVAINIQEPRLGVGLHCGDKCSAKTHTHTHTHTHTSARARNLESPFSIYYHILAIVISLTITLCLQTIFIMTGLAKIMRTRKDVLLKAVHTHYIAKSRLKTD